MRNSVVLLCLVLFPYVSCFPQYSSEAQSQEYTDSPDAQLITYIAERTAARPLGVAGGLPRGRQHPQQYVADEHQGIQVQPQSQIPPQLPLQLQPLPQVQPQSQPQFQSQPQPILQRHRPVPQPQPPQQQQSVASEEDSRGRHHFTTPIPILKLDKSQSLDGSYRQSWETGNKIMAEETGFFKNAGVKDQEALVQQGTYTYTAPDGSVITTSYTADEGGFHVEGSHLPTPPPIPEEIQKGLNQIYEGIRQQQEAEAKEAKSGKTKSHSYEEENNSVNDYSPVFQQRQYEQPQYLQPQQATSSQPYQEYQQIPEQVIPQLPRQRFRPQ